MQLATSRFIERQYHALFWPLLLTFLTFGVSLTIVGALLPQILTSFGWSYTEAGVVLAANSLGYTLVTPVAGMLIARIGPKLVLSLGLLLLAASLFFFGASPSVFYDGALNLLIGIGQGTMEVVVNYSLVRMERKGQSHLMSFSHASFSIGAIGGPTMVALVLSHGLAWQTVYHLVAALVLAVSVMALFLPFDRLREVAPEKHEKTGFRQLSRYPMFFIAFLALFVYVGLETGISNWVSEYYVTIFGASVTTGAFMVSVFWFGIFTGRVLMPIVYRGPHQSVALFSLTVLYTLSLAAALLMRGPLSAGVFFYMTSLGCSAVYPLVMTLIGRYFEKGQSVAVGFAASGGGAGSLAFPLAMSGVAEGFGVHIGFLVYLTMGVVLAVLAYLVILQMRARKTA